MLTVKRVRGTPEHDRIGRAGGGLRPRRGAREKARSEEKHCEVSTPPQLTSASPRVPGTSVSMRAGLHSVVPSSSPPGCLSRPDTTGSLQPGGQFSWLVEIDEIFFHRESNQRLTLRSIQEIAGRTGADLVTFDEFVGIRPQVLDFRKFQISSLLPKSRVRRAIRRGARGFVRGGAIPCFFIRWRILLSVVPRRRAASLRFQPVSSKAATIRSFSRRSISDWRLPVPWVAARPWDRIAPGRSPGRRVSPSMRFTAYWIAFSSSRTLPGQGYDVSSRRASGATKRTGRSGSTYFVRK